MKQDKIGALLLVTALVCVAGHSVWAAGRKGTPKVKEAAATVKTLKEIDLKPGQQEVSVPRELADSQTVSPRFLLYLPEGYGKKGEKWPLMLFLHGKGECGEDLEMVKKHGPPMLVSRKKQQKPFIIVSPQCKKDKWWNAGDLIKLVEHVENALDVDKNRIVVTGLSMGGFGTWSLIAAYPKKFAAAVPICGGGNSAKAKTIKSLPIWVFHGDADNVVNIEKSQVMVDALKKNGSKVKFTVYPGVGHNSWTKAYDSEEVYDWLLAQKRGTSKAK